MHRRQRNMMKGIVLERERETSFGANIKWNWMDARREGATTPGREKESSTTGATLGRLRAAGTYLVAR